MGLAGQDRSITARVPRFDAGYGWPYHWIMATTTVKTTVRAAFDEDDALQVADFRRFCAAGLELATD